MQRITKYFLYEIIYIGAFAMLFNYARNLDFE